MSAPKHTPGPWCVEDPMGFELSIVEAGKEAHEWRFIASCSLPDGDDDQAFTGGEIHANARLIAAAPDLLAMLSALVDEFGCTIEQYHKLGPDWTMKDGTETFNVSVVLDREELIEKARAAIAKAEAS